MSEKYVSRQQARAANAWEVVQRIKGSANAEKFALQAKRMPVRILTSGLGPSLSFLAAKKYAPELLVALNDWVLKCAWAERHNETSQPNADLMQRIITGDAQFLRLATDECMAYLQWIIRFAEAEGLLKDESQTPA